MSRARKIEPAPKPFAWRMAIALFALTVITYIPSMTNGFIWDDPQYVVDNPTLKSADGLWRIWTDPTATPQYYPMVHTTFWIESQIWGTEHAPGFHVDNILLHALAAVLLWQALVAIEAPWPWFAAAVFAVHPVMVESVTWVTERKNVLSIVFYLLAFHAYRRSGLIDEEPFQRRWYIASLVCFLLALLSKTVTCSLPAAILLIIWWKRDPSRSLRCSEETGLGWKDVKPLLPMFALGLLLAYYTSHLESTRVGARGPDFQWTIIDRCLIAGHAICFYAAKLIWPHPLIFMYPRWDLHADRALQFIYPAIVIAVVASLWLTRRWIGRGPLVAVLFFIGTLVPALGFVNVYPMRYSFVADHFQYLASIGLITLIVATLCRLTGSVPPRVILVVVLAPLAITTVLQQSIYKDARTLWENTIQQNETCWMAHVNLAGVLGRESPAKPSDAALEQSARALQLAPWEADTQYDMGVAMAQRSRWPEAAAFFQKAIDCDHDCSQAWSYLSLVLWEHFDSPDNREKALNAARQALEINPVLSAPHYVLGLSAQRSGDVGSAIEEYKKAVLIDSSNFPAHYALGNCLLKTGDPDHAAGEYLKILRHNPNDYLALTGLGDASLRAGKTDLAAQSYQRALLVNPNCTPAKQGLKNLEK